uniref:Uncharacterized protein n=1 Tax=Chromera velia CCMP2878 TaxID=1169474 RepID=A0A0G4F929_9ALVE|eukprot:Cvel_15846.t1-p1 / transcript=Cvel_15846.t1 / gene=Cvel_15846 / organism=Chromera_velia_CCMP2878 / gene_product=hypothetical protein / transcript_product=hypothetical protein / location=Cvel_scaffold1193:9438-10319(-) / protein_length=294 / sequence_SO=supercontig / SO=protein_coding / is_pseudo=false
MGGRAKQGDEVSASLRFNWRRSSTTPAELEDPEVVWPWTCERCAEVKRRQREAAQERESQSQSQKKEGEGKGAGTDQDRDTGSACPPPAAESGQIEGGGEESGLVKKEPEAAVSLVSVSGGVALTVSPSPSLPVDAAERPRLPPAGGSQGGPGVEDLESTRISSALPSNPVPAPPESCGGASTVASGVAAPIALAQAQMMQGEGRHSNTCWLCAMRKVWMVASLRRRTRDVGGRSENAGPSGSAPVAVAAPSGGDAAAGTEAAGASVSVSGGNGGTAAEVERLLRAAEPESYED